MENPLREFELLQKDIERFFEEFFGPLRNSFLGHESINPKMDVFETGDNLVVRVAIPGAQREDIDITIEEGCLRVSGETKDPAYVKKRVILSEIRYGRFSRSYTLPPDVDTRSVRALYKNGILEISLSKARKSMIDIE